MAINWNTLRELISYHGPEVIKYWQDPKQRFNELFRRGTSTAPKSTRVAPKGRPEDVEEEYYNRWKNYENMTQGERVGKLNDYQNRGNFGRSQQMLKEIAQNQPMSLENQQKISQRFGPPSPAPKPQQPGSYTVNDVPLEYQNKTMPESVKPPKPVTYGPSVRIETPKEFLNKPEQSTTNIEELRPTTPQGEIHLPMDEGARIQTPEQFIKKPKKTVKLPKAKPIDITSLPSFPKAEVQSKAPTAPSDIDRKRFALLDTYGDTGLRSLNDDAYVQRKWNAAMRGSRAQQVQQNYNRQMGNQQTARQPQPQPQQQMRQPVQQQPRNTNMYRQMGQVAQQQTPRFPGKDYYRNLGLTPQQIAARDTRHEANRRKRFGYKA